MAYLDTTVPNGAFSVAQAITTTADATNLFDVTGAGVTVAPAMIGAGGLNTAIGIDIGAGDGAARPQILITNALTTAGTGAGTVTFTLSAAPDNGSYSAGSYTTLFTSAAFVGTAITAGFQFPMPIPPIAPGEALPRFYKLTYTVSSTFAATFNANILINAPTVRDVTLYGSNYVAI